MSQRCAAICGTMSSLQDVPVTPIINTSIRAQLILQCRTLFKAKLVAEEDKKGKGINHKGIFASYHHSFF